MLTNHPRITLALIASGVAVASARADRISRADIVTRAARHPKSDAARSQVDRAREQKRQADALRWPRITVELGVANSLKATLVEGTAVASVESASSIGLDDLSVLYTGNLLVTQPLFTFGKIGHRRDAAEHAIAARGAESMARQADLVVEGALLYEGRLLAGDLERVLEEADHVLVRSTESAEERLQAGKPDVSTEDVLRFKTSRGPLAAGLNQARAGRLRADAGLRAFFGLPPETTVELADDQLAEIPTAVDQTDLIRHALRERPELAALDHGSAAYHALARAERAGYLPDLVLLGFLSAAYTPGHDAVESRFVYDPLRHFAAGVGVGLRWELWGNLAGARASEQHARATELAKLRLWATDALPADVVDSYQELQRARADVAALATATKLAKEWMVRANADYSTGMGDGRALTDAVQSYVTNRVAELDARYRSNIALARLSRASGGATTAHALYPNGGGR